MSFVKPVQPNQKSPAANKMPPTMTIGRRFKLSNVRWIREHDIGEGDYFSDDETEIREASNTCVKSIDALEDKGICCEKEVQKSIDERHVDRNEQYDWFREKDSKRSSHVLDHQLLEINLHFLLFGVNSPVLRFSTKLGGFAHQNNRCIGLWQEEKSKYESGEAHERGDVFGPSPSKI
jgi:hypothetical protein